MKCLVVDDDLGLLSITQRYLTYCLPPHWSIYTAGETLQARKFLHQLNGVNLLITDRHMPGESGVGLLHFVAENWPATAFILTSSDNKDLNLTKQEHTYFETQGIKGFFLTKPFSMSMLWKRIQSTIPHALG